MSLLAGEVLRAGAMQRALVRAARVEGLTGEEATILAAACWEPGINTLEIEERYCVNGTAVRRSLMRRYELTARGLIVQTASDGGRPRRGLRTCVTATDSGLVVWSRIRNRVERLMAEAGDAA